MGSYGIGDRDREFGQQANAAENLFLEWKMVIFLKVWVRVGVSSLNGSSLDHDMMESAWS